ncbi:hypothetical protein NDU88_001682 [Pleurodeles waltl]|uniref:Uncharacterized protein n=1 Tax=Pleurodeles waltl TaxID=8319 RepID=A0AAV7VAD8_PLEWA|nr:hypothetical protein NDU88_001682 [Pleurodeles waltl]
MAARSSAREGSSGFTGTLKPSPLPSDLARRYDKGTRVVHCSMVLPCDATVHLCRPISLRTRPRKNWAQGPPRAHWLQCASTSSFSRSDPSRSLRHPHRTPLPISRPRRSPPEDGGRATSKPVNRQCGPHCLLAVTASAHGAQQPPHAQPRRGPQTLPRHTSGLSLAPQSPADPIGAFSGRSRSLHGPGDLLSRTGAARPAGPPNRQRSQVTCSLIPHKPSSPSSRLLRGLREARRHGLGACLRELRNEELCRVGPLSAASHGSRGAPFASGTPGLLQDSAGKQELTRSASRWPCCLAKPLPNGAPYVFSAFLTSRSEEL